MLKNSNSNSSGHLVLSHFWTCMCSNVETNLSWTCLVSGLFKLEHLSVLLFCHIMAGYEILVYLNFIWPKSNLPQELFIQICILNFVTLKLWWKLKVESMPTFYYSAKGRLFTQFRFTQAVYSQKVSQKDIQYDPRHRQHRLPSEDTVRNYHIAPDRNQKYEERRLGPYGGKCTMKANHMLDICGTANKKWKLTLIIPLPVT